MSVTHVDFIARKIISAPPKRTVEALTEDMFNLYDHSIQGIINRYGDKMPSHVPAGIYPQKFVKGVFDTYGYGNVHNSVHQYKDETSGKWNRPMPFPADLRAIDAFLKKRAGKSATLGSKSDAFQWMDQKYQVTKSTLKLANKYKVKLTIYTMSDLVGHEEYADLIVDGGHSVVMQMGFHQPKLTDEFEIDFTSDDFERKVSPGAPSLKRRQAAIDKLKRLGVTVLTAKTNVKDLTKAQMKFVNMCSGVCVERVVV